MAPRLHADLDLGLVLAPVSASQLAAAGFDLVEPISTGGPVTAQLVRLPPDPPGTVRFGNRVTLLRWMDRCYLPVNAPAEVTVALFELVAPLYEELTSPETNIAVSARLLQKVLATCGPNASILDFGCGSGRSVLALQRIAAPRDVSLIGVDGSGAMRRLARRQGLKTLTPGEWARSTRSYDGAVATFVLHFRPPAADLLHLGRSLRAGSRFAANYFKAGPADIDGLAALLRDADLTLEEVNAPDCGPASNPLLVFRKSAS